MVSRLHEQRKQSAAFCRQGEGVALFAGEAVAVSRVTIMSSAIYIAVILDE